ncbi:peptide-methionine (R)-S-oxide reductase [Jannaschia sp. W003]|uniref:peptide-methionine (R)-S-oxide reductase n=1 Tax=Jannaschia sp. W003 TaxID=2867012 RepID=UPI0021A91CC7|nr:peptide-methionine (R)-S-oxide reductase [Jannaschia sp. W003]UWQ22118.1 peptide-methionine (R)-S-oxide reductase [Jannaschia sp. W003]
MRDHPNRRGLLGGTAAAAAALLGAPAARAATGTGDGFAYEVQRGEAEWRAHLGDDGVYQVLREGATEPPNSSPLRNIMLDGAYHCRGCDLPLYESRWKAPIDKGWVFFRQSIPNALLMSIDPSGPGGAGARIAGDVPTPEEQALIDTLSATEVHCRRCGSHIGHILTVGRPMLHCVNGAAMRFAAAQD